MFPRLIQPHGAIVSQEDLQVGIGGPGGGGGSSSSSSNHHRGDPCLVLTSDPKPRLRWTTDLHDRFVDAVTQLGGASKATPKAIMRTMGVKGLTLFHLKSHLQKYRLGKLSGKDLGVAPSDGGFSFNTYGSYDVKEALRAQMEVQSKLHLQVEAEKHLQIRQEAERRYMAMLERACKMLADQIIGGAITKIDKQNHQELGTQAPTSFSGCPLGTYSLRSPDVVRVHAPEEVSPGIHPHRADCSTESCLTSHGSPAGLPPEGSPPGGKKRILNMDSMDASLIWGE